MPIQEHEPLSTQPNLLSAEKRAWTMVPWSKRALKQPNAAVFQFGMNSTPRPTAPDETIAFGYMSLNKFHDREPEAVLATIEALDPNFFDSYPRKPGTKLDAAFKKAAIGELARAFYRHGLAAYGKPNLRKGAAQSPSVPLAAI